jgi:DNA gyrase subunit A
LVATDGGYAKRTPIEDYSPQGRGGMGVLTIQQDSRRGRLVGALIVDIDDEIYAITSSGGLIRTRTAEVRKAGRQTKGVRLMNLAEGTTLVAIAGNAEDASDVPDDGDVSPNADATSSGDVTSSVEADGVESDSAVVDVTDIDAADAEVDSVDAEAAEEQADGRDDAEPESPESTDNSPS